MKNSPAACSLPSAISGHFSSESHQRSSLAEQDGAVGGRGEVVPRSLSCNFICSSWLWALSLSIGAFAFLSSSSELLHWLAKARALSSHLWSLTRSSDTSVSSTGTEAFKHRAPARDSSSSCGSCFSRVAWAASICSPVSCRARIWKMDAQSLRDRAAPEAAEWAVGRATKEKGLQAKNTQETEGTEPRTPMDTNVEKTGKGGNGHP